VLVSITLVAMVTTIAAGAYSVSLRSAEKGGKKSEELERAGRSLYIIDAQIQSAITVKTADEEPAETSFRGDAHSMEFASTYSAWSGERAFILVSYRVERESEKGYTLHVREKAFATGTERQTRLLRHCDEIQFSFSPTDETDARIIEQVWKEEAELPRLVHLRFKSAGRTYETVSPIRIAGRS
jgi:type II secretory pathway component PulJ